MLIQLFCNRTEKPRARSRQEKMETGLTPVISKIQKGGLLAAEGYIQGDEGP